MGLPDKKQPDELKKDEENSPPMGDANSHPIENPFKEAHSKSIPEPCILVIFGASGDLTMRKLIPAIFNLMIEGVTPQNFAIVGVARRDLSDDDFRKKMASGIKEFSRVKPNDENLKQFMDKIHYHTGNFDVDEDYKRLKVYLDDLDKKIGAQGNLIHYLSTQPKEFPPIVELLKKNKLVYDKEEREKTSRVIIEKPFGHDLDSALQLQEDLTINLDEEQIYRIDHYLGKETVQNLMVFRFANSLFETQWNSKYIDNVQITVGESIGVEGRGSFYEGAGLVRDIIQNHLMQVLSIVAMEPPSSLSAQAVRDEKVKVLQAIRKYTPEEIDRYTCRGQYMEGFIEGEKTPAYRQEENVDGESNVETFAAMRILIDNWRWYGVPFFIRAGKRLQKRTTEIVINFKPTPSVLFYNDDRENNPNQIIFRIQPQEGTSVQMNTKVPGSATLIQTVNMDFQYASYFGTEVPEAYERLIF